MAFDFLTYALCKKASGGGSIPGDYTQVKQQVEQNTQDILGLNTTVTETTEQVAKLQDTVDNLDLENVITTTNLSDNLKVRIGDGADQSLENNIIVIPMATDSTPGLVKLANAEKENGVSADEESELTVNSLNLDKVIQDEGDTLILESN